LAKLLDGEAGELRSKFGAAGEDAGDARLLDAGTLFLKGIGQGFEKLGRSGQTFDVVTGFEHGQGLLDNVILVSIEVLHPTFFDELDDPAWVQVDAEADAAAILAEMLDG